MFVFPIFLLCPFLVYSKLVNLKEQPSVVSITNRISTHLCDGTIVTSWHVVTSCYCLAQVIGTWHKNFDPYDFKVIAGTNKRDQIKDDNAQVRDLKIMIVHPRCKRVSFGAVFDIGIIILRTALFITEYVTPADLGFYQEANRHSEAIKPILDKLGSCSLVTWFIPENQTNRILYKQIVHVIDRKICKWSVPKLSATYRSDQDFFCTTTSDDYGCDPSISGAPIFCDKYFLGIIQYNENCTEGSVYAFFRIDSSMDWIGYIISLGKSGRLQPCLSIFLLILAIKIFDLLYLIFPSIILNIRPNFDQNNHSFSLSFLNN